MIANLLTDAALLTALGRRCAKAGRPSVDCKGRKVLAELDFFARVWQLLQNVSESAEAVPVRFHRCRILEPGRNHLPPERGNILAVQDTGGYQCGVEVPLRSNLNRFDPANCGTVTGLYAANPRVVEIAQPLF